MRLHPPKIFKVLFPARLTSGCGSLVTDVKVLRDVGSSNQVLFNQSALILAVNTRSFQTCPSFQAPKKERKDADDLVFVKIRTLELNKMIFKMKEDNTALDKVVNWILRKNIRVPVTSLNSSQKFPVSDTGRFKTLREDNPQLKAGFFTPEEDEQVFNNLLKVKEAFSVQNDDPFMKELFTKVDDERSRGKVNIVGHFLAQGLRNPRLGSEVFNRAKTLFVDVKGSFTDEEEDIVEKFMIEEAGDYSHPYTELASRLGRSSNVVREFYLEYLMHKEKTTDGRFSMSENMIILEAIFNHNKNGANLSKVDNEILEKLSEVLKRKPRSIQKHWSCALQPILTRYEAGVLDVDFRHVLINYCVEKKIVYSQDADWSLISKEPMFKGTTPGYLSTVYRSLKLSTKQNNKKLTKAQLTSEALQNFLNNHGKSRRIRQDVDELLSFYHGLIDR